MFDRDSFICFFLNLLTNQAIDFSKQAVAQSANEINTLFNNCKKTCTLIASELFVQENLRKKLPSDIKQRYSEELDINNRLNLISSYIIDDVYGIYVIGDNGAEYKSNSYKLISDNLNQSEFYKTTIQGGTEIWFRSINGSQISTSIYGYNFLTVTLPIKDKATGKYLGVVAVDILESTLLKRINDSSLGENGYLFYMDENNNQVVSTAFNADYVPELSRGKMIKDNDTQYFIMGNQKYIMVSNDTTSKWKVAALISINTIQGKSTSITILIVILTAIISILIILISIQTSNSFSKPIKELMNSMKRISKGDWTAKTTIYSQNELGQMAMGFNQMVNKLNEQRQRILKEQSQLRKAQLDILQSQINPHFLYNTLDLIIWMARNKRKDEIISIVYSLTKLLRISLSKGSDIISLEDEITHIESYLTIQSIRYKDVIHYKIKVPDELKPYRIPKLTLQPIVENAIYHGLKETAEGGTIFIEAQETDNTLLLIVQDNGRGMDPSKEKSINDMFLNPAMKFGFGLNNVNERIKLHFGKDYGIEVSSQINVGTEVKIRIPKIKEILS